MQEFDEGRMMREPTQLLMMNGKKKVARTVGVILALLGSGIAAQQPSAVIPATQQSVTIHIPPQPLRKALRMFAEQTQLQVVYRSEQIDAARVSTAVEGTYSAEEALALLLGSSDLRAVRINSRTLAIHVASADRPHRKGDVVRASSRQPDQADHE
jgi:hypothetical protein